MCELFGITSVKKIEVNDLLQEFFLHSNEHPHGWGMATFFSNYVSLEKEPIKASDSNYLKERLKCPLQVYDMIAHIRYATRGELSYPNCHPFIKRDNFGRCWTLAHNGTIFEDEKIEPYKGQQEGETDSERILFYFIDQINQKQIQKGRALKDNERFELLEELIHGLTPSNKVNLLFYDGEYMYAYTNYAHSLHRKVLENGVIISTKPLEEEGWEPLPFAKLLVYLKGNQIFQGKLVGSEYICNPTE